jgi:dolichol-phosphate hexosyltransferase
MAVAQPVAQPVREQTLLPVGILPGPAARSLPGPSAIPAPTAPSYVEPASRHLGLAPNSLPFKLSILMSAHNAEATIVEAVTEVLKADYPCAIEVIVVDDGSADSTDELLSRIDDARLTIYRPGMNQGKKAALLSAARIATGSYVLLFAADPGYSAGDIPRLLAPVLADRCRVVYGTMLRGHHTMRQSYRCARGSRLLTWLANILFDACISDLHSRLKLIPVTVLNELVLREPELGSDTEMTALLLKQGIRPFEVPVRYYGGQHPAGQKISWRTAIACVRILLKVRMRRRDGRGYDPAMVAPDRTTLSEACLMRYGDQRA